MSKIKYDARQDGDQIIVTAPYYIPQEWVNYFGKEEFDQGAYIPCKQKGLYINEIPEEIYDTLLFIIGKFPIPLFGTLYGLKYARTEAIFMAEIQYYTGRSLTELMSVGSIMVFNSAADAVHFRLSE